MIQSTTNHYLDSIEKQRHELDQWIFGHWTEAQRSRLPDSGTLLVKGTAQPALVRLLPALLAERLGSARDSWRLSQAEILLRHLEIRKGTALKNWDGNFPSEFHAGILLTAAQQLARLGTCRTDVRYLSTALKILDWTKHCRNSRTAWKNSLYSHAQLECDMAISELEKRC